MPTTINGKLLNTNKHVFFFFFFFPCLYHSQFDSHYLRLLTTKAKSKHRYKKTVSFPAADSTQEMAEVFWRQPENVWARPAVSWTGVRSRLCSPSGGADRAEESQPETTVKGAENLRSACSLLSPQLEQQTTFFFLTTTQILPMLFSRPGDNEPSCTLNLN